MKDSVMQILLIDVNNIAHIKYHNNKNYGDINDTTDMAICSTLLAIKEFYNKFNPDKVFLAFDAKTNWRKIYTKNLDECVTDKKYKGHRQDKLTKKEKEAYKLLNQKLESLKNFLDENTGLYILHHKTLEGDDLVSGVCERFSSPLDNCIKLISSDKDYLQLLRFGSVEIINPLKDGKERTLEEWNNDPDLYIFEKCIRGDAKDNVRSSYPRLRRTKLVEAFYDDYKKENIMKHEFNEVVYNDDKSDYSEKNYLTKEVFDENKLLLDLTAQPPFIREIIFSIIDKQIDKNNNYNYIKFLRFCKKNEYDVLFEYADQFTSLFNN